MRTLHSSNFALRLFSGYIKSIKQCGEIANAVIHISPNKYHIQYIAHIHRSKIKPAMYHDFITCFFPKKFSIPGPVIPLLKNTVKFYKLAFYFT